VSPSTSDRQPTGAGVDPFAIFGLAPTFELDRKALRKRLLELQREAHPDFVANQGSDARAAAEDSATRVNAAFELLDDRRLLADHLVKRLGGPSQDDDRRMPQEFLLEVLEWNEALDDARAAGARADRGALGELQLRLAAAREDALTALTRELVPLPEHASARLQSARQALNALRYVDRALEEVDRLLGE
jgi:molecular chaperone HscB